MAGWSIRGVMIAAALASMASTPVWAQQGWTPPPSDSDQGWQQSSQEDGASPTGADQTAAPNDNPNDDDSPAGDGGSSGGEAPSAADDGSSSTLGGFASRDAAPPDADIPAPAPQDDDNSWRSWHSDATAEAAAPAASAAPAPESDEDQLDAHPSQAPGTVNSFNQPVTTPGFVATTGISNRDQAVSSCLAAVRSRVSGGAGAARVDGINGEWMVSGAIADGRAFYCSIHQGAIGDIQFGN